MSIEACLQRLEEQVNSHAVSLEELEKRSILTGQKLDDLAEKINQTFEKIPSVEFRGTKETTFETLNIAIGVKARAVMQAYLNVGVVCIDEEGSEKSRATSLKELVATINNLIKAKKDKGEVFSEEEVEIIRNLKNRVNKLWDDGDALFSQHHNIFIRLLHCIRKLFTWKVLVEFSE